MKDLPAPTPGRLSQSTGSLHLLDRQGFGFFITVTVENRPAVAWPSQVNVEADPVLAKPRRWRSIT